MSDKYQAVALAAATTVRTTGYWTSTARTHAVHQCKRTG